MAGRHDAQVGGRYGFKRMRCKIMKIMKKETMKKGDAIAPPKTTCLEAVFGQFQSI